MHRIDKNMPSNWLTVHKSTFLHCTHYLTILLKYIPSIEFRKTMRKTAQTWSTRLKCVKFINLRCLNFLYHWLFTLLVARYSFHVLRFTFLSFNEFVMLLVLLVFNQNIRQWNTHTQIHPEQRDNNNRRVGYLHRDNQCLRSLLR